MAGKIAKLSPFRSGPRNVSFSVNSNSALAANMEEDEIYQQFNDANLDRAEIIEHLRGLARKNGGRLPYQDQRSIFRGFAIALGDPTWEVRYQCIQLISELIPYYDDSLDVLMPVVMARLVPNIGDPKITVRRAVIQTLHVYMQHTRNLNQIFKFFIVYLL